jgi:plasmid maintenance system antidote protein VapI
MPSDTLTTAVRRALCQAPCSTRALAEKAGVPHSTLVRIAGGARSATPAVALALAKALRAWSDRCARLARAVEHATPSTRKGG